MVTKKRKISLTFFYRYESKRGISMVVRFLREEVFHVRKLRFRSNHARAGLRLFPTKRVFRLVCRSNIFQTLLPEFFLRL